MRNHYNGKCNIGLVTDDPIIYSAYNLPKFYALHSEMHAKGNSFERMTRKVMGSKVNLTMTARLPVFSFLPYKYYERRMKQWQKNSRKGFLRFWQL